MENTSSENVLAMALSVKSFLVFFNSISNKGYIAETKQEIAIKFVFLEYSIIKIGTNG